jgi:hypothetical protein
LVKQIHPHSLTDCLGLDESKNKDDTLSKHVVSDEVLDLIAKIPKRTGVLIAVERKLVSEKKEVILLKIHVKGGEICNE